MLIEYPKAIYNNSTKSTVTVQNRDEEDNLKTYFGDKYIGGTYTEIHISQAVEYIKEAKTEVKKEVKEKDSKEVILKETDPKDMKWGEFKRYAKTKGVKVPLRATRVELEKVLEEKLDGDNKRSDQEILPQT